MSKFATSQDMAGETRTALIDLLYRLADDEIVMGHRNSEWTGLGPILEEDIAFSSMAQDEMGHAWVYYQLLHELGEDNPDALVYRRSAEAYRCCDFVCLPNNHDWAFCVVRQYLYDAAESVRLAALVDSAYVPLAQLAAKLRNEEKYHLLHGQSWIIRLGTATGDSNQRLQTALDQAYPFALGMFEPTTATETLADTNICPHENVLQKQWQEEVNDVLDRAGLNLPADVKPAYGGRTGKHHEALASLLRDLQLVNSIDPTAKW